MSLFGKQTAKGRNDSIRKYTAIFGSLFSDLHIYRISEQLEQLIHVPIQYGKGALYEKTDTTAELQLNRTRQILPAMGFSLQTISVSPERHANKYNQQPTGQTSDPYMLKQIMGGLTVNLDYDLVIRTKNMDDMLQIIEQIVPVFSQDVTVNIKETNGLEISRDVVIKLNDISLIDNSHEQMSDARFIEVTIAFTLHGKLWNASIDAPKLTEFEIRITIGTDWEYAETQVFEYIFDPTKDDPLSEEIGLVRQTDDLVNVKLPKAASAKKVDAASDNTPKRRRKTS